MNDSLCFTGLVVAFNEGKKLRACLKALKFCSELIVVDLGSDDDSVQVAEDMGATILRHDWVPVVEMVWPHMVEYARNHWIIRADPDEVYPQALFSDIQASIEQNPNVGMIRLPHQFFFRGKPLYTTRWGQIKSSPKVFHRKRVILRPLVHSGIVCREGFSEILIRPTEKNVIFHYWVDSYQELFQKHWRYIKKEGEAQYQNNIRFQLGEMIKETWEALKLSLWKLNGIKGGFNGIFLSFFHAWYTMTVFLSLRHYQKRKVRIIG